ncbi:MAG: hypothetical protein ACOYXU_13895, partial [Nitrospirota bacterium]
MSTTTIKQCLGFAVVLGTVLSTTPAAGHAFSQRPTPTPLGAPPSQALVTETSPPLRIAGGVMVESYFPEPGESPESVAAKVDALNAKKAAQSMSEVPADQQEIPDNPALVSPQ